MFRLTNGFVCFLVVGCAVAQGATWRAKTNGISTGVCDSWTNACTLTYALTQAVNGDQVWVKSGTYGAVSGSAEVPLPIALTNGVKLIGGFAGTETLVSQSNPGTNVTILTGGGAAHVIVSDSSSSPTVLRGFKITGGQSGDDWDGGGGMLMVNSGAQIIRCVFESNQAIRFGAAVSIRGSGSAEFVNCDFHNNGTGSGGSVQPLAGGAIYLHNGSPKFTNCLFYSNKAGEGTVIANASGSAMLVNCTLVSNQATIGYGGGIFDKRGTVQVRNSILWGNTAVRGGNQIQNRSGVVSSVTNSNIQGGWTGTGNINSDPIFANPGSNDYKITCDSPCWDTGDNSFIPVDVADLDFDSNVTELIPKDLAFGPRQAYTVDMGAYEVPKFPACAN